MIIPTAGCNANAPTPISRIDLHWLWEASLRVRKNSASGVDGQTYADYEEGRRDRLEALLTKTKDGNYRAPPVKRKYIPKDGGEQRGSLSELARSAGFARRQMAPQVDRLSNALG